MALETKDSPKKKFIVKYVMEVEVMAHSEDEADDFVNDLYLNDHEELTNASSLDHILCGTYEKK